MPHDNINRAVIKLWKAQTKCALKGLSPRRRVAWAMAEIGNGGSHHCERKKWIDPARAGIARTTKRKSL
jgi:hypothetical protein